jgi:hypothetical protein
MDVEKLTEDISSLGTMPDAALGIAGEDTSDVCMQDADPDEFADFCDGDLDCSDDDLDSIMADDDEFGFGEDAGLDNIDSLLGITEDDELTESFDNGSTSFVNNFFRGR